MSRPVKKDDPQIHLMAAKYGEKIQNMWNKTQDENEEFNIEFILSCIKFFAHYIKYLPESSNDVLKLCQFYLHILNKGSIKMDNVVINRLIGICTTMMIQRKEDNIIRSTCIVLKDILEITPSAVLKLIVVKYSNALSLIFQKMYLVQTYYTQLRILDIFVFITKDLQDLRNDSIKKSRLMAKATEEITNNVFNILNLVDNKDLIKSSRTFLKFFNNNLFQKTSILCIEGRVIQINGIFIKQSKTMLVSFNGRNLTVSFFIPKKYLNLKDSSDMQNGTQKSNGSEYLIFIEFECEDIDTKAKVYNGKHYIDSNIVVKNPMTYDMYSENYVDIRTFTLRLVDEESVTKLFMDVYCEKFKNHDKVINDNASMIDKESIMTFQTNASIFNDLKELRNHELTQKTQDMPIDEEITENPEPAQVINDDNLVDKKEKVHIMSSEKKTRPTRERKKVNYNLDIYDEKNMSNDCEKIVPYQEFKSQQKKKSSESSKITQDSDNDGRYLLKSEQIITETTMKRNKMRKQTRNKRWTKIASKRTIHYKTDDENEENECNIVKNSTNQRRPRQSKKDQKNPSTIATFKYDVAKNEQSNLQQNDFDVVKKSLTSNNLLAEKSCNLPDKHSKMNPIHPPNSKKSREIISKKPVAKNDSLNSSVSFTSFFNISEIFPEHLSGNIEMKSIDKSREEMNPKISRKEENSTSATTNYSTIKQAVDKNGQNNSDIMGIPSTSNEFNIGVRIEKQPIVQMNFKKPQEITSKKSKTDEKKEDSTYSDSDHYSDFSGVFENNAVSIKEIKDLEKKFVPKNSVDEINQSIEQKSNGSSKHNLQAAPKNLKRPLGEQNSSVPVMNLKKAQEIISQKPESEKRVLNPSVSNHSSEAPGVFGTILSSIKKYQEAESKSFISKIPVLGINPSKQRLMQKPKESPKRNMQVTSKLNAVTKRVKRQSIDNQDNLIPTMKKCKLSASNVAFSSIPEENSNSKVERWLQSDSFSTPDSFSVDKSGPTGISQNPGDKFSEMDVSKNIENSMEDMDIGEEDEVNDISSAYANDEHQHYSSPSEESIVSNDKEANEPKQTEVDSSNEQDDPNDPCKLFDERVKEIVEDFNRRKKKLEESELEEISKIDEAFELAKEKCLEQWEKTSSQFKLISQLQKKLEAAKARLLDDIDEHEKLVENCMLEIEQRQKAYEQVKQENKDKLVALENEAIQKNEELIQEIWREYVNNFNTNLQGAIDSAYQI